MGLRILVGTLLALAMASSHGAVADVQALMGEGKLPQALSRVDADLARDKTNVELQFLKGLILTRLNRLDAAAQVFQRITEAHPELPEPYNNLAVVHAARGDFDAAQQALQKAINTHPSYATAHENLGDIYARMASEAYNQALQLDESNSSAKTKLALINDLFPPPGTSRPSKPTAVAVAEPAVRPAMPGPQVPAPSAPAPAPAEETTPAAVVAETVTAPAPVSIPEPVPTVAPETDPAPATVTTSEPAAAPAEAETDVRRAVAAWSAAWSARDVDTYLAAYGAEFMPPDGMSRKNWEAQRRERLQRARYIKLTLSDMETTEHGPAHVQVLFRQRYESDAFADTVRKMLILKKSDADWKIVEESLR